MDTAIMILAAGNSSRLGRPKQLLAYKNKPLLQVVSDAALQTAFRPVTIVLGAYKNEIARQINGTVNYVINDHWQEGMGSSIAAGLAATLKLSPGIQQVIIAVSDQAFISQEIFEQLYQQQQLSAKGIVASKYEETAGTPVLFSKKYFADLLALKGDSGAKSILKTYPKDIETITFEKGEMDIDTEEDYKKLIERS